MEVEDLLQVVVGDLRGELDQGEVELVTERRKLLGEEKVHAWVECLEWEVEDVPSDVPRGRCLRRGLQGEGN